MIEVLKVDMRTNGVRIGSVMLKYYQAIICCDLCLYKNQNFWIRMPEIWVTKTTKRQFVFWETRELSDAFQKEVLKKVFDVVPLTVEKAIEMRKDFFATRKKMTLNKNKTTLTKKNARV